MTHLHVSILLLALSSLLLLGLSIVLALRLRRLQRLLTDVQAESAVPAKNEETARVFAARLAEAQLRSRLQQGGATREPPDKYRVAASLAARGLSGAEIAEILQIPAAEAEQVAALARAARAKRYLSPKDTK